MGNREVVLTGRRRDAKRKAGDEKEPPDNDSAEIPGLPAAPSARQGGRPE